MRTIQNGNAFSAAALVIIALATAGCAGQASTIGSAGVDNEPFPTATVEVTDANFQSVVLDSPDLVMVDFWAEWCGPCKRLGPVVEELAEEYAGRVVVGKMDIDSNPATPDQFGIQGIPALLLFKNGKLVDSLVGVRPKSEIAKTLDTLLES